VARDQHLQQNGQVTKSRHGSAWLGTGTGTHPARRDAAAEGEARVVHRAQPRQQLARVRPHRLLGDGRLRRGRRRTRCGQRREEVLVSQRDSARVVIVLRAQCQLIIKKCNLSDRPHVPERRRRRRLPPRHHWIP
jgi:hypothetical protein